MLNLYLKYSQTPLFLLHSDKVSDAAAVQEIDDMEPESKRRKTDCGKMSTEAWTSCYSVSGCMMFVLADSSSDLPHTSTTAGGGLDKTGVRNDVAKPPVDGTKTDKMEESLTCVICQDLLHDCIRFVAFILWPWLGLRDAACPERWNECVSPSACSLACTSSAPPATRVGWSVPLSVPPAAAPWRGFVRTTSWTTWWRPTSFSTQVGSFI